MAVVPYKNKTASKKDQVAEMFDGISPRYDFLNHLLSAGIDRLWRRKAIRLLAPAAPGKILDVATGTADFAIEAMKLNPLKIVGVDISEGMLEVGRQKVRKLGMDSVIELRKADSERLPFSDNSFDAVLVSFGVRNFEHLEKGLADMNRVLKPGGTCLVLEFSKPRNGLFRAVYNFYFKYITPSVGAFFSKDRAAYRYLPASVQAFPDGADFLKIYEKAGFTQTKCIPLTFGVSSIYIGKK